MSFIKSSHSRHKHNEKMAMVGNICGDKCLRKGQLHQKRHFLVQKHGVETSFGENLIKKMLLTPDEQKVKRQKDECTLLGASPEGINEAIED